MRSTPMVEQQGFTSWLSGMVMLPAEAEEAGPRSLPRMMAGDGTAHTNAHLGKRPLVCCQAFGRQLLQDVVQDVVNPPDNEGGSALQAASHMTASKTPHSERLGQPRERKRRGLGHRAVGQHHATTPAHVLKQLVPANVLHEPRSESQLTKVLTQTGSTCHGWCALLV